MQNHTELSLPWICVTLFPTEEWHRSGVEVASLYLKKQTWCWLRSLHLAGWRWTPAAGCRRWWRAPALPAVPPCMHGALGKDRKGNQPKGFYQTYLSSSGLISIMNFSATVVIAGSLLHEKLDLPKKGLCGSPLLFQPFPRAIGLFSSWSSVRHWNAFLYLFVDAFSVHTEERVDL